MLDFEELDYINSIKDVVCFYIKEVVNFKRVFEWVLRIMGLNMKNVICLKLRKMLYLNL